MPTQRRPRVASNFQHERKLDAMYRQRLAGLVRTHDRLSRKLAIITEQIHRLQRQLGVRVPDRAPAQGPPPGTLADTIAAVLGKRPMSATEITEAVRSRGYVSFSQNFRGIVLSALAKDKRFKRIDRGQWARK